MTNSEMKADRFLRWHKARVMLGKINAALEGGSTVQLTTYTKAVRYTRKHLGMFKATKTGVYVQRGAKWDSLFGVQINVFH